MPSLATWKYKYIFIHGPTHNTSNPKAHKYNLQCIKSTKVNSNFLVVRGSKPPRMEYLIPWAAKQQQQLQQWQTTQQQ